MRSVWRRFLLRYLRLFNNFASKMRRYLVWRTLSINRSWVFADACLSCHNLARWTLLIILQPFLAFSQVLNLPFVKRFKVRVLRLSSYWCGNYLRWLRCLLLLFMLLLCIVIEFRRWNRSERELLLLFGRRRLFH